MTRPRGALAMGPDVGEAAGLVRSLDAPAWHQIRQELQERSGSSTP